MKKFLLGLIIIGLSLTAPSAYALSTYQPFQGGTGSTTLSGILIGAGTSPVKTLTVGSGLSLTGTTLTVTATNAASTTLLGDTNTWSGTDTFSNTIGGSISGNAATVTNGVVTTGTYLNPAWITGIPYSILTGTVPTWNQNTTGSAATLTTARTINGVGFNGSANIVVASTTLLGDVNTWTNTQGMSITGNAGTATKLATARTLAITGDLAWTSPSFDGSGNVTAAGTLATVNTNVGSFTNANITVNAKGLITAASNGTAGSGAYSFTPNTNFAVGVSATSTPIWDTAGLMASSTSYFDSLVANTTNAAAVPITIQGAASQTADLFDIKSNTGTTYLSVNSAGALNGYQQIQFNGPTYAQFQDTTAGASMDFKTVAGTGDITFTPNATTILRASNNGNVGIGATSTPGTLLSVQGVANFATATSTFSSTGGINLTAGCFAVGGVCVGSGGGSGTVTGVLGTYPVISDGNATTPTISLAFGTTTSNTWAGLQQFGNATSTLFSAGTIWDTGITGSTQCLHVDTNGLISGTGSDCGAGGGGAFDFTPTTNFGAATNSTSTTIWDKLGFQASSTSQFDAINTGTLNFFATSSKDFLITYNGLPFITASSSSAVANTGIGIQALAGITTGNNDTAIGYQVLKNVTTGFWDTAIGSQAGASEVGGFGLTAVGYNSLHAATGNGATAVGFNVLQQATGSDIAGFGYDSMQGLTTGANNSAFGSQSFGTLSSGASNSAFGSAAGFQMSTGDYNVFIGANAGQAGSAYTGAEGNVVIGQGAASGFASNVSYNTIIGFLAAKKLTTGTKNIIIGQNGLQLDNIFTGTNNIQIGSDIRMGVIGSNALNIQNVIFGTNNSGTGSTTSSGQIGIGTTSPFARFAIQANSTDANTTLFAIGSSTASATTTLFSISNTGAVTLANALTVTGAGTGCATFTSGVLSSTGTACGSGGSGGVGTVSTSSLETAGQLPYWTTTSGYPAKLGGIATSSIGAGTGLSFSGTAGAQVGGTNGTYSVNTSQNITTLSNLTTNGFVKTSGGTGALSIDTSTYLTANQSITLSGAVTGTGATAITTAFGNLTQGWFGVIGSAATTPTAHATSTLFTGSTGQAAWFSGSGLLAGTSELQFTSATSTFASDVLLQNTSSNVFQINDGYGTPDAIFQTASTTGSIFTVAATTSPNLAAGAIKLFDVDQYGHLMASSTGASPTVSCTPTNNPTLGTNANDTVGDFTTGTLSTACTVTFAHAYSQTPEAIITSGSTGSVVGVTSRSTTSFTVGLGTAATGDNISYFVIMP